jgi:hypothetical protein
MAVLAAFRMARSIVVALIAASALALAVPATAGASTVVTRPTAKPSAAATMELENALANVETQNKVSWWLLVSWNNLGAEPVLQVALERLISSPSSGFEFHDWSFDVASSSLSFNDKTGTLDTGTQTNPVASLDLSFKTTSSKAATCSSGKETIYDGTLSGKASLVTGLKGGGTVSGTYKFNVTTPYIAVDHGCVPPAPDECGAEVVAGSQSVSGPGPALFAGTFSDVSTAEQVVGISEETKLSSPSDATRTDVAAMLNKTGKVYATYTGTEVKLASAGLVNGSGTVKGGKPDKEPPETCTYDSKSYKDTAVVDEPADYSGKFSATPSIGTAMTVPSSTKTAFYIVVTSKKT